MPIASIVATRICTFTKFCRVAQPAEPAPSTAARARRGKMPTIQFQMPRPSMRMNSVAKSASSMPARKCPSDEPTESAPLTSNAAVLLGRRDDLVDEVVQLLLGDVEGSFEEPRPEVVPRDERLRGELVGAPDDLRDAERQQTADDRQRREHGRVTASHFGQP